MDHTRIEATGDSQAASFDALARSLDRRLQRRRVFGLLAATLATGVLGAAGRPEEAAAKKRGGKKGGKGKGKGGQGTSVPPVQPPVQPPAQQPDASQRCLAAGDRCGTQAGVQGSCRHLAAADNQAGFLCTSDQAGNECTVSTQCGAGARCAGFPIATCRVVIA